MGGSSLLSGGAATLLLIVAAPASAQAPSSFPEQGDWNTDGQSYPNEGTPAEGGYENGYGFANGADGVGSGSIDVDPTMVPPNVEAAPYEQSDGFCYVGGHPVDTRVTPGASWDPTEGEHLRPYPPVDLRLFALRDGCYYFIGDPRDFGYGGTTYAYYGAHPVLDAYGGGWCFMMGAHTHLWRPWSPYFTVVGSWNYWRGPFDPYFWSYWPYYSVYYRSYYPHFYGGGRFYRGGGYHVAPAVRTVPVSAWRTQDPGRRGPVMRGGAPAQAYRPGPSQPGAGIQRGYAPPAGMVGAPRPGASPSPGARPSFSPGPGSFRGGGGGGRHR